MVFSRKPCHASILPFAVLGMTLVAAHAHGIGPLMAGPNVVFILADDLGWGELGCYGQQKIRTPNIDRLAAAGTRFLRHYSGAPVCAPSRCTLMTGQHTGRAEIRGNRQAKTLFPEFDEGQVPISESAITLAKWFQQAGYATAAMGKWGLGAVGSTGDPNRQGFDQFFGYNCQAVAHSYFPKSLWRNRDRVVINDAPIPGHAKRPSGPITMDEWQGAQSASPLIVAEALRFIEDHRDHPFFLFLPFTEPHMAMQPDPELVRTYPIAWDEQPYRGENGYLPHPRPRAAYAAMISQLDRHVGQVLQRIEQLGLSDKTLVVFTSDNGTTHAVAASPQSHVGGVDAQFFNSTAGLNGYKGSLYEGGIRVPLIVRWPGHIPAGAVSDVPSYFPDHFPTLCAAAGLTAPANLDGVNMWPAWQNALAPVSHPPMVWVFPEYGGQCAVTFRRYKVLRQRLGGKQDPKPWEVYDLQDDPAETSNLASTHPEWIERAQNILSDAWADNATFPLDRTKALGP